MSATGRINLEAVTLCLQSMCLFLKFLDAPASIADTKWFLAWLPHFARRSRVCFVCLKAIALVRSPPASSPRCEESALLVALSTITFTTHYLAPTTPLLAQVLHHIVLFRILLTNKTTRHASLYV